jgi:hypothetical protein
MIHVGGGEDKQPESQATSFQCMKANVEGKQNEDFFFFDNG